MLEGSEDWIQAHVAVVGPIEIAHERPWATVMRVPVDDGNVWFKACAPVQGFEPRLSAQLCGRWPDRVAEVVAYDQARAWLLLADAGTPMSASGNPPEGWLSVLPGYAELQRGETARVAEHLAHEVPDLRLATLPRHYDDLLRRVLPLTRDETVRLQRFADRFGGLCEELADHGVADTVQHDDLHAWNVYTRGDQSRVLDWGDASISHPFMSLVVTFRFLEETNHLPPTDPWFARLRDAYLEPWGRGHAEAFTLAIRVGNIAHVLVELRHRSALDGEALAEFDKSFRAVLHRALAQTFD